MHKTQGQCSLPRDISNIAIRSSSNMLALGSSYKPIRDSGSGRAPGGANDNPLQCSRLDNPMDRGAWWDTVHGLAKSQTGLRWLSKHECKHHFTICILHLVGFYWNTMQVHSTSKCVPFHVLFDDAKPTRCPRPSYLPAVPFVTWDPLQNTRLHLVPISPEAPLGCNNFSELPLFLVILRLKEDLANIL